MDLFVLLVLSTVARTCIIVLQLTASSSGAGSLLNAARSLQTTHFYFLLYGTSSAVEQARQKPHYCLRSESSLINSPCLLLL